MIDVLLELLIMALGRYLFLIGGFCVLNMNLHDINVVSSLHSSVFRIACIGRCF